MNISISFFKRRGREGVCVNDLLLGGKGGLRYMYM